MNTITNYIFNNDCPENKLFFHFSTYLWIIIIIISLIAAFFVWFYFFRKNYRIVDMDFELLPTPKVTFKVERNVQNLYIANRIYIELVTRKAALTFEEEKDVIIEVYNSWYKLFTIIREEIKNVPGNYLISHDPTNALIGLTLDILNLGLRPHLTTYQAKFRKWYDLEIKKEQNIAKEPQEIQKECPYYTELIINLKQVNHLLINYSNDLKKLIKK